MADVRTFEKAIEAAGDAGDFAAVKELAAEMKRQMQQANPRLGMPEPIQFGQPGMRGAIRETVRGESRPAQAYAGAGSALALAAHGVDQTVPAAPTTQTMLGRGLQPVPKPDASADVENWRSLASASPDTIGGNILGTSALFAAAPTRLGGVGVRAPVLASRPGMVADTMLTSGLLNAATTPGGASERTSAGILSMGGGAVPALYAAGAGGRRALTSSGRRVAIGEGVRSELGDSGSDNLLSQLQTPDPGTRLGVLSSSAMRTGNPQLEMLERGSRVSSGGLWRDFDRQNAAARWSALTGKAGTPEELAHLKGERDRLTSLKREAALGSATGEFYPQGKKLEGLADYLNELSTGSNRPNRDVQTLVGFVRGELDKGVTPEQLYTVRKMLTDGIKAGPTSELSQAARAARPQRMEIIGKIDDVLNDMSGGKWSGYLDEFKALSPEITSKEALQNIVSSLERGQPAGAVPTAMGESAAWKTVGNLRDRFGQKEFGSKVFDRMTPEDRELLETLVGNLKSQSDVMSARGILGSPTAQLLSNAQRPGAGIAGILANAVPFGGVLSAPAFNAMGQKAEKALADLLQDPEALAEALQAAKRAQTVGGLSSRAGAATGAGGAAYSRNK